MPAFVSLVSLPGETLEAVLLAVSGLVLGPIVVQAGDVAWACECSQNGP